MLYIGIDPGKTGAIVSINESGELLVGRAFDKGIGLALESFDFGSDSRIVIEKVHAMPGQGVTSMFNFGMSYGFIRGWLNASNHKYRLVTPQKWQQTFRNYSGNTGKERTRAFCEKQWGLERFILPRCRVPHLGLMDAASIAYSAMH